MTVKRDRAVELAVALLTNPWVDKAVHRTCETMLTKWEREDMEAEYAATHGESVKKEGSIVENCKAWDAIS